MAPEKERKQAKKTEEKKRSFFFPVTSAFEWLPGRECYQPKQIDKNRSPNAVRGNARFIFLSGIQMVL